MARNLHIRSLKVNGEPLDGHVHGGVLVPARGTGWHVHASTTRKWEWTIGTTYRLEIETREGGVVVGEAALRRSDGQAHYFVGDAVPAELADT
jgi:hypothetical protein